MKSTALQPTLENITQSLLNDSIGRNEDLRCFLDLLNNLEGSYSLALDGGWGSGKTFFVQQVKLVLDYLSSNPHIERDPEIQIQVEQIVLKKNSGEEYKIKQTFSTVYYDAWMNDNHIDPIITLLYTFASQLGIQNSVGNSRNYWDIILKIIDVVEGKVFSSIKEALKSDNIFNELVTEEAIQDMFSRLLNELIVEHGDRLVVFIDELDRCSPSFAVKLLERIKHYLLDERVIFVFAVNISELQHAVNNFYGVGFSGDKYLERFFDMVVQLPEPNYHKFFKSIGFEMSAVNTFNKICHLVIKAFNLKLREITRFVDAIKQYDYLMNENAQIQRYGRIATNQFCIIFILPILIGLSLVDRNELDKFVSGKNPQPLIDVYSKDLQQGNWLARLLLRSHETLDPREENERISLVLSEEKIRELYHIVFVQQYTSDSPTFELGEYTFYGDTKRELMRSFAKLSPYAKYN